jgi:membrane-associated phospholipid phosphatase
VKRADPIVAPLVACSFALASSAKASEERTSVYEIRPAVDLPVLGLGLAASSAAFIEVDPPACLPSCDPPERLNAMDRTALGRYSTSSRIAADAVIVTLVAGPPVWSALDTWDAGAWLEDAVVHGQTLALTQGLTQIVKFSVRRPAPLVYDERVPLDVREGRDAARAFWSGHTATAFASATSHAVTYWLRHPRDPWRYAVLATNLAAAMAVGMLKVDAGFHYWSDIGAGAVAGASLGVLVPMLHARY